MGKTVIDILMLINLGSDILSKYFNILLHSDEVRQCYNERLVLSSLIHLS